MKLLPLMALVLLTGCNSRKEKGTGSSDDTITPVVSASEISYALVRDNVFTRNCTSCHGDAKVEGGVNLKNYGTAQRFAAQIKADVDSGRMPQSPSPPLSQRQKDLIDLWVAQGSPESAGGPPAPPKPPLVATFASIKESVFTPKCYTCHNPTGHAKNVKLDEAAQLLHGQNILVVPGHPESSSLVRVTSPTARHPMPPPPKSPLSADEAAQIKDWVASGAEDDSAAGDASKFLTIQNNIIQPKCTGCHGPEGSAEHLPLNTVADLTQGGDPYVFPKNADASWLIELTDPSAPEMPPPGPGSSPLTQEEWNTIKSWINNGANQ